MNRDQSRFYLIAFTLLFPWWCVAAPHFGANLSASAIANTPPTTRGYQVMLNYDPDRLKWRQFNVYFDGGISHFWVTKTSYNSSLNIYSIAPVVRYNFKKRGIISPFLELSIGLSYLNHTRLDHRNLGIHFAFQDRVGAGALLGPSEKISIGVHALHYSNAHLSEHNSGITLPLVLDIGYRFN